MNAIKFFLAQTKYNFKNAHALKHSFWVGVITMIMNNLTFFIIWLLFMQATGPINGWSALDVFGMIGVSVFIYGIVNSFFRGIVELPQLVIKGTFDSVLLSPINTFIKTSGAHFSVSAYGDLIQGAVVSIIYSVLKGFDFSTYILYFIAIIIGSIIFLCIRLICSLVVFFIHDGETVADQMFEIFLRPSLYPGAIFPDKLKLFFMTIVPSLLTSAVPIDSIKSNSSYLLFISLVVTAIWIIITYTLFNVAIKRYGSGNFLR